MRIAALAAVGAILPGLVLAQTPDAASAAQQEQRVRDGLVKLLGSDAGVGEHPVKITANADRYDIAIKLGDGADAPMLTGSGLPDADGVWTIDHIRVSSPAKFTSQLPNGGTITYTLTVGEQSGDAVLDPALAKPSTLNSTLHDYTVTSDGGPGKADTHVQLMTNMFSTTPASQGRVNMTVRTEADGYKLAMTLPKSTAPLDISFGPVRASGTASNLSVAVMGRLYHDLFAFNAANMAVAQSAGQGAGRPGTAPVDPAKQKAAAEATHRMMADLTELLSAGDLKETLSDVAVTSNGSQGSLHMLEIDMSGADEAGVTHMTMPLSAEGLTLPEMGLGDLVQLIPSKLSLTPSVSGVPTAALVALLRGVPFENGSPDADFAALFAPGTLKAGLDSFSVAVGPSQIDGHFSMAFKSQTDFSGTGQITATNFDALQQLVAGNPMTAQGGAVLILAKGMARNEGGKLVWDLSYADHRMLVNNQDLSAMGGGGGRSHP